MEERAITTPGVLGYLLAYGLAAVLFAVPMGLLEASDDVSAGAAIVVVAMVVGVGGIPFGLVGLPIVHLICRRSQAQHIHVLVAGLAGALACLVVLVPALIDPGAGDTTWSYRAVVVGGLATAAARAFVIPLVARRRDQRLRRPAVTSAAVPRPSSSAR